MRIPAEALPLYRPERAATLLDPRAAQPVGEAARLGATLPKSVPQGTRQPPEDVLDQRRRQTDFAREGGEDGRRGERRKSNQPVLIDTRLSGRRRADGRTTIDTMV